MDMNEDIGFFKRVKYLFLVAVLGAAYFFWAIFSGIYEWIKDVWNRRIRGE